MKNIEYDSMKYLKKAEEIEVLKVEELVLLYFNTLEEIRNPHMKFDGVEPIVMKNKYIRLNREQLHVIIDILHKKNVSSNYLYLRYRYLKIKYKEFINKNKGSAK